MKPWFQSDNSKIRKERAHVGEVTKVATTGLGAACCGQRLLGKDAASFASRRIPVAHSHAAWLHQAAAKSTVYVHLSCLGQNCQEHGFPGAGTWRCRAGMAPGAICLAQLLMSNISRMELIQSEGNKTKFMFHSGGSSQEFWNFLQLGLGESR